MIFNILTYSIGSLIWGILISLACLGLIMLLIKAWYNNAFFKLVSYIIFGVLGIILIYNSTIIVGASSIKSDLDDYETKIIQLVNYSYSARDIIVDEDTSNDILQHVFKENPILHFFVGNINIEGADPKDIPHSLTESFRSDLNKVILKKVMWSAFFIIIAIVALIKTIGRGSNGSHRGTHRPRYNYARISSRRNRPISRRR